MTPKEIAETWLAGRPGTISTFAGIDELARAYLAADARLAEIQATLTAERPYLGIEKPDCGEYLRTFEAHGETLGGWDPLHSDYFIGGFQAGTEKLRAEIERMRARIRELERRNRVLDVVQAHLAVEHYNGNRETLANTAESFARECREAAGG